MVSEDWCHFGLWRCEQCSPAKHKVLLRVIWRQPLGSFEPENGQGCIPPHWDDSRAGLQEGYGSVPEVEVKHIKCPRPLVDPKLPWQSQRVIDHVTCGSGGMAWAPPSPHRWTAALPVRHWGRDPADFPPSFPRHSPLWWVGVDLLQLRTIAAATLQSVNTLWGLVMCKLCFSFGSK